MSKQLTFDDITEFKGTGSKPTGPKPSEVLTPDSPRWGRFVEQLESRLSESGCDSRTQRCAVEVMHKMGGINIEASLAYFEDHGGYCDCEILLNVDREWSS